MSCRYKILGKHTTTRKGSRRAVGNSTAQRSREDRRELELGHTSIDQPVPDVLGWIGMMSEARPACGVLCPACSLLRVGGWVLDCLSLKVPFLGPYRLRRSSLHSFVCEFSIALLERSLDAAVIYRYSSVAEVEHNVTSQSGAGRDRNHVGVRGVTA